MLKPIVLVKKVGRKTRKPNCGAVLIIRTTQPIVVFGFFQAIATLEKSESIDRFPAGSKRRNPVTSVTPNRVTRPPTRTNPSEHQRVPYWPISGMKKLASNEPSVGNPPVNANQNQPTADPRRLSEVVTAIQTRNP